MFFDRKNLVVAVFSYQRSKRVRLKVVAFHGSDAHDALGGGNTTCRHVVYSPAKNAPSTFRNVKIDLPVSKCQLTAFD